MEKTMYDYLETIEGIGSSIAKTDLLREMLEKFPEAEKFLRFAYDDTVYGLGEKTFITAFSKFYPNEGYDHISDWFGVWEPDTGKETYTFIKLKDLETYAKKLKHESGISQEASIKNFFAHLPNKERKWWCRALLHDLRCGVKVKTVNAVFEQLNLPIIEKFGLQLCGRLDVYDEIEVEKRLTFPCTIECKYDGIRLQAEVWEDKDGSMQCELTSRRGKDRTDKYPGICAELCKLFVGQHVLLDGEITAESFQKLTRLEDKSTRKYVVWDLLNDEKLTYNSRWDNLISLCSDVGIAPVNDYELINNKEKLCSSVVLLAEHFSASNIKDLQEYYEELNRRGEEGIIIKLDDRSYSRSSRKNMYKCKKVFDADLKIIGYKLGEGKRSGMVSTLELIDKSETIRVDVGSGIDDATSQALTTMVEQHKVPDFIGKICEILYNEKTETGSLRFPRFVQIRDDKTEPDDMR